jgi:SHS2 domain-containing protein
MYEIFEHTADVGLRIRATDLNGLFADAGKAFFSLIVANPDSIRPVQESHVEIQGDRYDDLLFDWLAELLYRFDTEHLLLAEFEVSVGEHGLKAVVRGEPVDRYRHELEMEVKAITYHGLKLQQQGDQWTAEVIVDI